ncbi:MAG: VanZ family protein [Elusimicrobiaceae bacterium]|nr:VanZ family protein [Elusimicrobiaceae bacterium]
MQSCLLFGLFVLVVMFLVPQGAKLCSSVKAKTLYQYILLSIYLIGIFWLTLFNRWGMDVARFRFQPFYVVWQILNCWFGFHKISTATCRAVFKNSANLLDSVHATPIEDLLLNIILFMPLGFLLPYICSKLSFKKTLLLGFVLSLVVEISQYLTHWGCCDIDDIINNTLGTAFGYLCFCIYRRCSRA